MLKATYGIFEILEITKMRYYTANILGMSV
jgi:hypothetical protein